MPCSMYDGATSGDFANAAVGDLKKRVAALEEAFCGLLKSLPGGPPHGNAAYANDDLRRWWENHIKQPGHKP